MMRLYISESVELQRTISFVVLLLILCSIGASAPATMTASRSTMARGIRYKTGFRSAAMLKMIVYQDRLGTNLGGQTPPKDVCFLTVGGLAPPGPLSRLLPRCGNATLVLHCRIMIFVQKRFTVNLPRQVGTSTSRIF
jgi:hypothetical protein